MAGFDTNLVKSDISGIFNGISKPFESYTQAKLGQDVDTSVEKGGSGGGGSGGGGGGGMDIGGIINSIKGIAGSVKSDQNSKENIRPSYDDIRGMIAGLRSK
jgi:hypothetical protein